MEYLFLTIAIVLGSVDALGISLLARKIMKQDKEIERVSLELEDCKEALSKMFECVKELDEEVYGPDDLEITVNGIPQDMKKDKYFS